MNNQGRGCFIFLFAFLVLAGVWIANHPNGNLLYAYGAGIVFFGLSLWLFLTRSKISPTTHGSSHFATSHELKDSIHLATTHHQEHQAWNKARLVGAKPESKLLIGFYRKKIIALSEQQQESHVLLVAPTGKGKTSRIIIPALLREFGSRSLFINDTKGELVEKTIGSLAEHHTCWVFAPTRPEQSQYYNPLAYITSMEDAEDFAACWVENTGKSPDEFWNAAAKLLITATVIHLRASEPDAPFCRLADLLCGTNPADMKKQLLNSPSILAREVATAFIESTSLNERLAGSIFTEMATRFFSFKNPTLRTVTSRNELDFHQMVRKPVALFLSVPASAVERLKPLSACLIMQMMNCWIKHAERSPGGRLARPVAFYLDEFANVGTIPHFTQHISLVRSRGIAFLMAIQDFGQLNRVYGEDGRDTILANATTHIVFPGCGLQETRFYSERIGETTVFTNSSSESSNSASLAKHATWTQSETSRRLMTTDELRTMPPGYLLVLTDTLAPLLVWNRPYYSTPDLLERADLPYSPPVRVPSVQPISPLPTEQTTTVVLSSNQSLIGPGTSAPPSLPTANSEEEEEDNQQFFAPF